MKLIYKTKNVKKNFFNKIISIFLIANNSYIER